MAKQCGGDFETPGGGVEMPNITSNATGNSSACDTIISVSLLVIPLLFLYKLQKHYNMSFCYHKMNDCRFIPGKGCFPNLKNSGLHYVSGVH